MSDHQSSTGPRTAEGKARSSVNARKHGFTGRTLIVATDEREEHEQFLAEWENDLDPIGAPEKELFAQIINAAWTLRRLSRAEAELIDESLGSPDPLTVDALQSKLKLYSLYQQRAERTFHKAMAELKKIQEERLFRSLALPEDHVLPLLPDTAKVRQVYMRDKRTGDRATAKAMEAYIFADPRRPQPAENADGQTNS